MSHPATCCAASSQTYNQAPPSGAQHPRELNLWVWAALTLPPKHITKKTTATGLNKRVEHPPHSATVDIESGLGSDLQQQQMHLFTSIFFLINNPRVYLQFKDFNQ